MLFREAVAVYYENRAEHINTLCGQNAQFFFNIKPHQCVLKGQLIISALCNTYLQFSASRTLSL
jgi:hypothetical protein